MIIVLQTSLLCPAAPAAFGHYTLKAVKNRYNFVSAAFTSNFGHCLNHRGHECEGKQPAGRTTPVRQ